MKKSKFIKIFIGYIVIILFLSISTLIISTSLVKEQYLDSKIESMLDLSKIIQQNMIPLINFEDWDKLDLYAQEIYAQTQARVSVVTPEGAVMAESLKDFQEMESHRNRPEIKTALQGQVSHTIRYSTTAREDMLYVATPILLEDNIIAAVRLSIFLDEIHLVLNRLRNAITLITLLMLFVSLIISYYISGRLITPINKFSQAFEELGKGNLETRILTHQEEPEIKTLTAQFNQMAEKIKLLIEDLSLQTEELETIISSIESGIVLLDNRGKIILGNKNFKKYLYSNKITGKYYWEIIRTGQLNKKVSELLENRKKFTVEIDISGKSYLCTGNYIDKKGKSVLIFQDISRSRELAQVKKDLIANISHELRTPLTSIKGYIETIEGASDNERVKYIQIIKRNTERLISMVDDLLTLSKLEDKGGRLQIEKVDLKELTGNMIKLFKPVIRAKKLSISSNIEENIPKIEADTYKIEQMLINLIDNAIKYTEKGGIDISVKSMFANKIKIEINDSGIGIKKEELNNIFERFYVVNKARSRQYGGTGLGLSIVKHIVMLHKGEIEIDSKLGLGTRLAVILPVKQA